MILVAQMLSPGGEIGLPRTTERHMRKRADSPREIIGSVETFKGCSGSISWGEPRSKFVTSKPCIACPEQLERGECSGLPVRTVRQSHRRKPMVRGLLRDSKSGGELMF